MPRPRFHLAFPVTDLQAARHWYTRVLGCTVGRESSEWIDFNFLGTTEHQIVAHLVPAPARTSSSEPASQDVGSNQVDGKDVPVPHFGLILEPAQWQSLAERLQDHRADFIIQPHTRFPGQTGEQSTMFVRDPSGNGLEFKAFADMSQVFAREDGRTNVTE